MKSYLKDIKNIPMLSPEELPILCAKINRLKELLGGDLKQFEIRNYSKSEQIEIKDCLAAYHRFIEGNLRLVIVVAKKYRKSDFELENLVQFGNIGLVKAVEKFDYSRGTRFNVYASFWIKQAISRGITNTNRPIRLPIHIADRLAKIRRETKNSAKAIDLKELSDKIGLSVDAIRFVLEKDYSFQSSHLQADSGSSLEDTFSYTDDSENSTLTAIESALVNLSKLEQVIVRAKFGIGSIKKTNAILSKELNIRIKEIETVYKEAIKKLSNDGALKAFCKD